MRLVLGRTALGLSQKESAAQIGVDQGTLAKWEREEREPHGRFAVQAQHFPERSRKDAFCRGVIEGESLPTSR